MIKTAAGIDIRHVPYRGDARCDRGPYPLSLVVDLQPALQQIREGKVRVLGVTTPKRVAAAPDIPTLAEAGLPGFELVAWQGRGGARGHAASDRRSGAGRRTGQAAGRSGDVTS